MQCFLGSLDTFPNAVNQCSELAQPDAVCCDKPIVVDEYIYAVVTASGLAQPDVSRDDVAVGVMVSVLA